MTDCHDIYDTNDWDGGFSFKRGRNFGIDPLKAYGSSYGLKGIGRDLFGCLRILLIKYSFLEFRTRRTARVFVQHYGSRNKESGVSTLGCTLNGV